MSLLNMGLRRVAPILLGALFLTHTASAEVPHTLRYQGYLTDALGAPLNGAIDVTFTLYDAAVAGTTLWTDTQSIEVTNGLLAVSLGDPGNPFPVDLFDSPLFLGVAAGTDAEMAPRQPLAASAYALQARDADSLQGLAAAALDQSAHVSNAANPHRVDWDQLRGIPAGFADKIDDDAGGDITDVTTGFGLIGGATSGRVALAANLNEVQRRIAAACPAGQSIRAISGAGGVTCEPDDDSNAGTLCGPGLLLNGDGACVAPDGHDHTGQSWSTFSSGSVGFEMTNSSSTLGSASMLGSAANGPTQGYLGLVGSATFQGIAGLDIAGDEIGVLGVSTGASGADNVGVYGFSNGIGMVAQGATLAARFIGDVEVTGNLSGDVRVDGALTTTRLAYSAPRTHFYSLGDGAFVSRQGQGFATGVGTGGSYFTDAGSGGLIAGVHLPDGAVVTRMRAIVDDDAAGNLSVTLAVRGHSSSGTVTMANVVSSGTPGITTLTDTSISAPSIDNATNGYNVRVFSSSWPGNSNLKIKGVVIEYTVSEAD